MNSEHVGHLVSPAGPGNQRPLACIWRLAFRRTVWIWERRLKGGAGGTFRDLWVAVSLAGLVVLAFTLVARSSSNSSHGAMNLNTLLFLFQFCVLVSSIPGRGRGEFFQEPPGPLLPLSSNGLSVYWAARVVRPPAMLLGLAYFGIGLGSKTVAPSAVLLAWLADVTGIAGL